jgi:dienelactone hydrolase
MAEIALFHSALGVRPGITDAAERLRADGHDVLVVDQYEGRVFDDQAEAGWFVEELGFPELMRRAEAAVAGLADGFLVAGFSNGAGMAEHLATRRRCGGAREARRGGRGRRALGRSFVGAGAQKQRGGQEGEALH